MTETETQSDEDRAYELNEQTYELMEAKLQQAVLGPQDIRELKAAAEKALHHPDSTIWITMTLGGFENTMDHHLYPEGKYEYPPFQTHREAIKEQLSRTTNISVNF